jgi:hypothetical protein
VFGDRVQWSGDMSSLLVRLTSVCAAVLMANSIIPAFGQDSSSLKARCSQLMTFFDWYGASRSENTDGARNHTRLGAEMDCKKGNYQEGVAKMEELLRRKKFDVSAAPAAVVEVPMGRTPGTPVAALTR